MKEIIHPIFLIPVFASIAYLAGGSFLIILVSRILKIKDSGFRESLLSVLTVTIAFLIIPRITLSILTAITFVSLSAYMIVGYVLAFALSAEVVRRIFQTENYKALVLIACTGFLFLLMNLVFILFICMVLGHPV